MCNSVLEIKLKNKKKTARFFSFQSCHDVYERVLVKPSLYVSYSRGSQSGTRGIAGICGDIFNIVKIMELTTHHDQVCYVLLFHY